MQRVQGGRSTCVPHKVDATCAICNKELTWSCDGKLSHSMSGTGTMPPCAVQLTLRCWVPPPHLALHSCHGPTFASYERQGCMLHCWLSDACDGASGQDSYAATASARQLKISPLHITSTCMSKFPSLCRRADRTYRHSTTIILLRYILCSPSETASNSGFKHSTERC